MKPKFIGSSQFTDEKLRGLLRSVGDSGSSPLNVSGSTVLALLSNIKNYLSNIETALAPSNNGYIDEVVLTNAGVDYPVNINGSIGRNCRHIIIRSISTNTGEIMYAYSDNGVDFTGYFRDVLPGTTIVKDNCNIHTLILRGSAGGDVVLIDAW